MWRLQRMCCIGVVVLMAMAAAMGQATADMAGSSVGRMLQQTTTPPISITGWSSYTEIANQLAAALVDTAYFDIVSKSYQATSTATAGRATFRQYGTYYLDAGKPPGHLLAPRFPSGAIVLSTAKIVGTSWPNPLPLSSNRVATEVPGSVRSVRLELNLKAKVAGYVKSAWAWQDALVDIDEFSDAANPDFLGQSSFRYIVNGANRALTTDNRAVNVDNLYGRLTAYPNVTASYVMEDHAPVNRANILPIEFGGFAFLSCTKRTQLTAGQSVKIVIVLADVPLVLDGRTISAPTALYLPPRAISMLSNVNCFSNLPAPPVSIVGWNSATDIATQLAAALVDTNTFTIVGATYSSTSTRSAGLAAFRQYGTWARNAGKPPGHMLAPLFPNGAVVLSTAQILGTNWPRPILLTPGRVATEIKDSVRSVKLVLDLKAKIDGSLRMRWVWQDTQANIFAVEEGNPTSGNNTFRIRVNGVERALTLDNRFIKQDTLYKRLDFPDGSYRQDFALQWVMDSGTPSFEADVLPVEFAGLGFINDTKRVTTIPAGQTVRVEIILGDVDRSATFKTPTALYFPPKVIALTAIKKCSAGCSSSQTCCGGFCCNSGKCCGSTECCASNTFQCVPNALATSGSRCCPPPAICTVNDSPFCCAPGTRCVGGIKCEA